MFKKKKKKLIIAKIFLLFTCLFFFPRLAYFSNLSPETIIDETNLERGKNSLKALNANQYLSRAANLKAEAIFSAQEFNHTIGQEKFSFWVKEAGYDYEIIGENLAIDFVSAQETIKAWLSSETHRKNLLNPRFSEIGVAVKEGELNGKKSIVVVQIFGSPRLSLNLAAKNEGVGEASQPIINPEPKPVYVNYRLKPLIADFVKSNAEGNSLYNKLFGSRSGPAGYFYYINYYILSALLIMVTIIGVIIIKQQKSK